jgi:hypothetical protein
MATKRQWALGAAGTIALGIIGTALWEYLVRPGMGRLASAVLTVTTFGIERLRDEVYRDVAPGFRETGTIITLQILVLALGVGLGIVSRLLRPPDPERRSLDRFGIRIVNSKLFSHWFLVFLAFYLVSTLASINRQFYVNAVIANFNQLLSATAPHLGQTKSFRYVRGSPRLSTGQISWH